MVFSTKNEGFGASAVGWLAKRGMVVALVSFVGCASYGWNGGIDADLRYREKEAVTTVAQVSPGSAAQAAGLLPGDVILSADGEDLTNAPLPVVKAALSGPIGSVAVLTVQRGGEILELSVERRRAAGGESR